MLRKYLREIELSAYLLLFIGVLLALLMGYDRGLWPCAVGLLLLLTVFVYKAFHWNEYARDNKRNVFIMLITILFLILQMIRML